MRYIGCKELGMDSTQMWCRKTDLVVWGEWCNGENKRESRLKYTII